MKCSDCKFAVYVDNGYSNYTVEGRDFFCGKKLHPNDGFDMFYAKAKELDFGETCVGIEEGEGLNVDVDGEVFADFTPEERELYDKAMS